MEGPLGNRRRHFDVLESKIDEIKASAFALRFRPLAETGQNRPIRRMDSCKSGHPHQRSGSFVPPEIRRSPTRNFADFFPPPPP